MKAITLAPAMGESLIADGRKSIETRAWRPPHSLIGQRIAIHAGKRIDRVSCILLVLEFQRDDKKLPLGA